MLKLAKFFALAGIVFFVACKKDTTTTNVNASDAVGVWTLTEAKCDDGKSSTVVAGAGTLSGTFSYYGKDMNAKLDLKADKTFTSSGDFTEVLTINYPGIPAQTQEIPINDFLGTGTYSISGNTMTVVQNGQTQTSEILELTTSKLRLKYAFSETDNSDPSAVATSSGTVYYTLTK